MFFWKQPDCLGSPVATSRSSTQYKGISRALKDRSAEGWVWNWEWEAVPPSHNNRLLSANGTFFLQFYITNIPFPRNFAVHFIVILEKRVNWRPGKERGAEGPKNLGVPGENPILLYKFYGHRFMTGKMAAYKLYMWQYDCCQSWDKTRPCTGKRENYEVFANVPELHWQGAGQVTRQHGPVQGQWSAWILSITHRAALVALCTTIRRNNRSVSEVGRCQKSVHY